MGLELARPAWNPRPSTCELFNFVWVTWPVTVIFLIYQMWLEISSVCLEVVRFRYNNVHTILSIRTGI